MGADPELADVPLKHTLEKEFNIPVLIENDVNLATLVSSGKALAAHQAQHALRQWVMALEQALSSTGSFTWAPHMLPAKCLLYHRCECVTRECRRVW